MALPLVLVSQFSVILVLCLLGGFVLWQRGRNRPGQLLALLCLLSAGWVGALAGESILAGQEGHLTVTLLGNLHLQKVFATLSMAAFVGFTWSFPSQAPSIRWWHVWGLLLLTLMILVSIFTPWSAVYPSRVDGQIHVQYRPLHYCFLGYMVLTGLYGLGFMLHRHRTSTSPLARAQIAWVTVGIGISYGLAVGFSLLLPTFFRFYDLQQAGTLAPAIGFMLVTYAIVKYRVMELVVVLNRTITWLLMSLLLFLINLGIAAMIGGWIRSLNNWQLALIGTLLFFPLFLLTRSVQPTITRLMQREYHAMGEAVDGLMAEAGELTDLHTLSRFILQRSKVAFHVPSVSLLLCDQRRETCRLVRLESEEDLDLATDDPFLAWLAENVVTLEREQVEQRQRHESIRPRALDYFNLVDGRACLTLVHGGQLAGVLNFGERSGKRKHLTKRELNLLVRFRSAITLALENARMHETELVLREKQVQAEFLSRELQEAHEMQASLLPRRAPSVAGLEAAGQCRPAHDVGGDFFDYLVAGEETMSVILGDVSGKGLRSAMHAVLSSGLLRTRVRVGGTPGEVLAEVNLDLYHLTERNIFTAISFAEFDGRRQKLSLINAGLPYPLLRRAGAVQALALAGLPLGVMPEAERQTIQADLEVDDLLVFHSDGITEASTRGGEMFGDERLQALVAGLEPGTTAPEASRLIWEEVDRFAGGAEPFDDMTLVVVRVTGS